MVYPNRIGLKERFVVVSGIGVGSSGIGIGFGAEFTNAATMMNNNVEPSNKNFMLILIFFC